MLNRESGLKGMAGENDFRELKPGWSTPATRRPRLAFDVYCYQVRKYVGAYYAVLGRVDAVVFTAGVGRHAARPRGVAAGSRGARHPPRRRTQRRGLGREPVVVSADHSPVAVLVVPTNEEWEIARQALTVVRR